MNRDRKEREERILREIELLRMMSEGSTLLTSEIVRAPTREEKKPPAGADHARACAEVVGISAWTPAGG